MQRISINHSKTCMFLTLLTFLLISAAFAISIRKDDGTYMKYRCPEMTNSSTCSCSFIYSDYRIQCPAFDPKIIIKTQPNVYVYIDCKRILPKDYSLLPSIYIGNVSLVQFKRCPLPLGQPLKKILDRLHTKNVRTLLFQIYDADLGGQLLREHFKGLTDLERLVISVKGLSTLPDDLFIDLKNLTWLDFRSPNVHFPRDIFQKLNKLDNLELGGNKLEYLEKGIFQNQNKLLHLNLWGNNLKNLTKETFEGLLSITDLDLSSNNISILEYDVFSLLKNLSNLNLNGNHFKTLPQGLFSENKNLIKFSLTENQIPLFTLPNGLLSNLPNLLDVHVKCYLEHVPDDLFKNSKNLHNISLSNNNIESLPSNVFADQINLLVLDLSHNLLSDLSNELFVNARSLIILSLSYNHLVNISRNTFNRLQQLRELYLDNNQLHRIHPEAFITTKSLQILDLHNNKLSFITDNLKILSNRNLEINLSLQNLKHLRHINLRNNSITNIYREWLFNTPQLEELDLSYNNISLLSYNDLQILSTNIKINLTHNSIQKIDFNDIDYLNFDSNSENIEIFLDSNSIICNCKILQFILFLRNEIATHTNKILKIIPGNSKCSLPFTLKNKLITDIKPKELLCSIDDNSSLIKRCPNYCKCFIRSYDETLLINCSNAQLKKIPQLPRPEVFNLKFISLHIENNHLIQLPHADLPGYMNIKEIHAINNNISELNLENIPKNLEILNLENNNLTWINNSIFQIFNRTNKLKISFGNNPWICNCNKFGLLSFVQNNIKIIQDLDKIYCTLENNKLPLLLSKDLCNKNEYNIIILIIIIIIGFGLFIGIFIILCYKYRKHIKLCIFNLNLKNYYYKKSINYNNNNKNRKYDALIIYSYKDENFIKNNLIPNFENISITFKLCFYNKEWIADEFLSLLKESRRLIVILSINFLEFLWNKIEYRNAYISILNKRQTRVIIIIYDDIIGDIDNLDIELNTYIKMNSHIKWNDPWFWDKLRHLMPHHQLNYSQIKCSKDDKLKLITTDRLNETPSLTKPPAMNVSKYKNFSS